VSVQSAIVIHKGVFMSAPFTCSTSNFNEYICGCWIGLRATSHTRPRACDHYISSTLISDKGGAGPSLLPHYAWGTIIVYLWMQDGCQVYMGSYVALNRSCFMVTWTIFKIHHLEVGLIQNRETMAQPNTHNRWFLLFLHAWGPTWIESPLK
jgi:hypothetical protein